MQFWDNVAQTGDLTLCLSGTDTELELLPEIDVEEGLVLTKGIMKMYIYVLKLNFRKEATYRRDTNGNC